MKDFGIYVLSGILAGGLNLVVVRAMMILKGIEDYERVASVSLSETWFSNKEPTELDKRMEEYIITGGVYGSAKNTASVRTAKGKGRVALFLGLLFYPNEILKKEHPVLNKHPWLIPFYQVKRWFRVLNKDKRKKVADIYKAAGSATDESAASVDNLLKQLNLKDL